ncbi:hypothetical protein P9112_008405 [Eukaryota sp. TZLM1-RC]
MSSDECVRVVVRCRPLNNVEKKDQRQICVDVNGERREVTLKSIDNPDKYKTFTFDSVYDPSSEQRRVYDETALPLVDSVLQGYNGTIFAYGQTGTGKTYTMEGAMDPPEARGIIPNCFEHIFSTISASNNTRFLVRASMLEIYNEDIHDLLNDGPKPGRLEIRENPETGPYVEGLVEETVTSADDLMDLLRRGTLQRTTAETNMNKASSRSHSIFTIRIESSEDNEDDGTQRIRVAKLHLVDLAGSERQSKTGATGMRLLEASKINKSLLTLGYVIKALVEGNAKHVPYRDSKLTRLLQDSLGGNAKTVMIATVGPASWNYDESLATLRYANSAKSIKNKPIVNEDPKDSKIRDLQEELERLREQLKAQKSGVSVPVDKSPERQHSNATKVEHVSVLDSQSMEEALVKQKEAEEQANELQSRLKELEGKLTSKTAEEEKEKEALLEEQSKLQTVLQQRQAAVEEYEAELRAKEEYLKKQEQERLEMANMIKDMEEKLLVGGELVDKAKQQEIEMRRLEAENEERRRQEIALARELQEKQEEKRLFEDKYASLNEEVASKTKKLRELFSKVQSLRGEIQDLEGEFQDEREDFLDQIRQLNQQLQLKSLIIDSFVPQDVVNYVEQRAEYLEDTEEWVLPHQQFVGNVQREIHPLTSSELKLYEPTKVDLVPLQRPSSSIRKFSSQDQRDLAFEHPALLNTFFGTDQPLSAPSIASSRKSSRPGTSRTSREQRSSAIPKSRNLVREKVRYA